MLKIKSLGFRRCYSRRKRGRYRRKVKKKNEFDMSNPANYRVTLLPTMQDTMKESEIVNVERIKKD
jgi:hypothetical protein